MRATFLSVWVLLFAALGLTSCDRAGDTTDRTPTVTLKAEKPVEPAPSEKPKKSEASGLPAIADLVDGVKSAVVNVEVKAMSAAQEPDLLSPFQPFGRGQELPPPVQQGLGSGFVIDERGFVLTNHHVVQDAVDIRVKLEDGRSFDAEVVGRDPLTDVALLKLEGDVGKLPTAKLGDSDAMRVGEWVVAIGNPFGLASSVSVGILSARARNIHAGPYDDFLQTDAAINPGNSGGPLFNLAGEVIGINTAIVGSGSGIGFAVPSNLVKALLPQLQDEGEVSRGWLGVSVQDLSPELAAALDVEEKAGAIVLDVNPGSPAKIGGIEADDVVVEVAGKPVASAGDLTRRVALHRPGSELEVGLVREGKKLTKKVKLGTRPDLEGLNQKKKQVVEAERPSEKIGIALRDLDERTRMDGMPEGGSLIVEIQPGSPAERAGLVEGMVITEVNKKRMEGTKEIAAALKAAEPGSTVLLRAARPGGQSLHALQLPK